MGETVANSIETKCGWGAHDHQAPDHLSDFHRFRRCHRFDVDGEYQLLPIEPFLETLDELEQEGTVEAKMARGLTEEIRSATATGPKLEDSAYA